MAEKGKGSSSTLGLELKISNIEAQTRLIVADVAKLQSLSGLMVELQKSVDFLAGKFEDFKQVIQKVTAEFAEVKKNVEVLQAEQRVMSTEIKFLQKNNMQLFYDLHLLEVEIVGIPFRNGESLQDVVLGCAKAAKVPLLKEDIVSVMRKKRVGSVDGIIQVTFGSLSKRNDFVLGCKSKRLNCEMVGFPAKLTPVFINAILSPAVKQLMYKAKKLQKEKNWRYVWAKNGLLWVKRAEGDNAVQICLEKDLELLCV